MSEVEIQGWRELMDTLDRLPARVEKNIVRGMVANGANYVRDELKAAAPILKPETSNPHARRPGQLRDGIIAIMLKGRPGQVIGGIRFRLKADTLSALKAATRTLKKGKGAGVDAASAAIESIRYWTAVEYGHSSKARPFIRSTWDRVKMQTLSRMVEYARRRIARVKRD